MGAIWATGESTRHLGSMAWDRRGGLGQTISQGLAAVCRGAVSAARATVGSFSAARPRSQLSMP